FSPSLFPVFQFLCFPSSSFPSPLLPSQLLAPAPGYHVLDVSFSSIAVPGVPVSGVDAPGVSFPTVPDRILAPAPGRHVPMLPSRRTLGQTTIFYSLPPLVYP